MVRFFCPETKTKIVTGFKHSSVTYSRVVLFVHFDGLISLGGDQSALRVVEHAGKDARLAVQRSRLHGCMNPLEVVARPPIPHVDGSIVGYRGSNKLVKSLRFVLIQYCSDLD